MYGAADAFVLPTSELECFGLPVLESLACGRPVLAAPVGAIPELLRPFEPAWLADGSSPEAIADAAGPLPDRRSAGARAWRPFAPRSPPASPAIGCSSG